MQMYMSDAEHVQRVLHIPRRFDYRVIHGLYWYYDLLAQPMENVWDECKKRTVLNSVDSSDNYLMFKPYCSNQGHAVKVRIDSPLPLASVIAPTCNKRAMP